MARFQFRLDKLRRLREMARDERRGRLAEAFQAQQLLTEQQAAVGSELTEARAHQREMIESGTLDVNQVLETQRHQRGLEGQRMSMSEQSATLEIEIEKRRIALAEADRQVRLLDRLEDRQRAEHERNRLASEMKRLDEAAARCRKEYF